MESPVERSRRLHIAVISYYLPPVDRIGAGYQMHYMANAYARDGHVVTVFSAHGIKADDALYELVPVPSGRSNRVFRFGWNLRRYDLTRFDLLHSGGDTWWAVGKDRPYHVSTYHGSCLAEMVYIKGLRERLRMLVLGAIEVACTPVVDRRVAVSKNTRKYIPMVREVIYNGVDLSVFKPGPVKSTRPSILFVGTMENRKRGSALLGAFKREIVRKLPCAELWIVREENEVVADGVRWFGRVGLPKLVELYQQAWVFCLPSSYEGFGLPYVEAMACGTPVVATPNVGAREVLESGRHGCIVDLGTLGAALIRLLTDAPERERLRLAGIERAREFGFDRVVRAYLGGVPDRRRRMR